MAGFDKLGRGARIPVDFFSDEEREAMTAREAAAAAVRYLPDEETCRHKWIVAPSRGPTGLMCRACGETR